MRCAASALMSSKSDPASVSNQKAADARDACGTDVPEPRTTSFILANTYCFQLANANSRLSKSLGPGLGAVLGFLDPEAGSF